MHNIKKKIYQKKKDLIFWYIWLILIVIWNFGYPKATPVQDVIIAVILSLFFIFLKKQK